MHDNQCDVRPEIDVDEEICLLLGEGSAHSKEATVERLGACAVNRGLEGGTIGRLQRADFDATPVSEGLDCRIAFGLVHQSTAPDCAASLPSRRKKL